jgi:hypothetical protein
MYIPENPAPITTASNSVVDLLSDSGALSGTVAIAFASVEDATGVKYRFSTQHRDVARDGVEGIFPTWSMISFLVKRAKVTRFILGEITKNSSFYERIEHFLGGGSIPSSRNLK